MFQALLDATIDRRCRAEHSCGTPRTGFTRVRPDLVADVSVDLALDGRRGRHPVRFMRSRNDLATVIMLHGSTACSCVSQRSG